jgi:TonB-dependent starch-binding outer membrane protein SusC
MAISNRPSLLAFIALGALFVGLARASAAQQGTVTGQVTDKSNQRPVSGAQVLIVGTTLQGLTTREGRYTITNVPTGTHQVQLRMIGFSTTTRSVTVAGGQTATADFALTPGAVPLDAVIVTATGEARARELGNSVSTLDVAQVTQEAAVGNFADLLNARATGVQVTIPSGSTGDGARVRIRGSNSVSLSNEPVIIVDGIRVDNDPRSTSIGVGGQQPSRLNDLNSDDIESIEVIKGPAAAALYGTAAANGILQISTKQGRPGPARWNVYVEGGSIADYTTYPANFTALDDTLIVVGTDTTREIGCLLVDVVKDSLPCAQDRMQSFNPLEANSPFRTGSRQQYGLSVSGGTDAVTYFVSGEFEAENGIYAINNLNKRNFRANLHTQVSPKFDLAVNAGYVSSNLRRPQNDNNSFGILASGLLGLTDSTNGGYGFLTPAQSMSIETRQGIERFTGSLNASWRPTSFLTARAVVGVDVSNRFDQETTFPGKIPASFDISAFEGDRTADRQLVYQTTANFNASAAFNLSPTVTSTTSAGAQYFRDYSTGNRAFGRKLVAGSTSLGGTVIPTVDELTTEAITLGAFIQEQVGIRDRLFLTAAVRGDDNSAFGSNFNFIVYPKFSASWVLSDEPFFPRANFVSSLRLRFAYGLSGLQPGSTDAVQFFNPVAVTVNNVDVPGVTVGVGRDGVTEGNLGNPNLKPEKTRELEVGFDADLFGQRAQLEFTYYDKKSRDALIARRLAPSIGSSRTRFENLGEVSNKGMEIGLNTQVVRSSSISWDFRATAWGNRNRLIKLGQGIEPILFGLGGATQRHQEGYPLGSYFVLPFTYNDANGDGIIAVDEIAVGAEPTFHGSPSPSHGGTLSSTVTLWNRVRIYGLLDGRFGQTNNNSTEDFRCGFAISRAEYDRTASLFDQARCVADALLPTTTEAGFMEKADFVKLREVAVTLFAPATWAEHLGGKSLSLTVSGQNLATWTKYTGFDPEIANNPTNFSTADFLTQPPVRRFTARINMSF